MRRENMTQNQIAYHNMLENQRANIAREDELNRSNKARESENTRANLASEGIGIGNLKQRAFEYGDMAGFNKALSVAQTAQNASKALENTAKAAKTVIDTMNPFNKWY